MNVGSDTKIPKISSRRLSLKRLVVDDITDEYIGWLNNRNTTRYLEVRFHPQSRSDVENYVRHHLRDEAQALHFGVFDRNGSRLVGTTTLNRIDPHHLSSNISFVIGHPDAGKRGYATEAVHAATHYAFTVLRLMKIWGGYYDGNKGAERVFLKNGYNIEGRLRGKLVDYTGERVDHIFVGITPSEFKTNEKCLIESGEDR